MAIRFVLGTSGAGKTRWCIDAIAGHLRRQDQVPLVFLVPEQATFQIERAILSCPGIAGYSRLRVMSFNRLQFWLCNTLHQNELSSDGRRLMVRRALSACAGKLGLLRNEASSGFSAAVADLIRRFHDDNCIPEILSATAGQILAKDNTNPTGRKLADLAIIYQHYLELINQPGSAFVNPDAALTDARAKVKDAAFLRGARIWVDGFSGFTLQQQDLFFEMLAICSDADIALCLDAQAMDLENTDPEKLDLASLFAPTERTYTDMLGILRRQQFPLAAPVLLNDHPRFKSARALARIERCFFAAEKDNPTTADGAIEIVGLTDARGEADYVAQTISRMMRDTQLRYRDIAVIVPRIEAYAHYLSAAFDRNRIPYFLDRPQGIQSHPLIELLTATLRAIQSRFNLPKMLALLKNRLRLIDDASADRLDNYCRAFGIAGQDWFSDQPWTFENKDPFHDIQRIDLLRRTFIAPLRKLNERLSGSLTPTRLAEAVFAYLAELGVSQRLTEQSQSDPTDTRFAHRRVWKKWVEVFDECVRVFDGQELSAAEWIEILLDALSGLSLKLIPAAADQVLIGSIERSRHPDIKVAFLVGASNAQFPVPLVGEELLTEQDVKLAAAAQLPLSHPRQQALDARRYLSYIALTRASQKIILTFPTLDDKGVPNTHWTGIDRLSELFSDVQIRYGGPQAALPRFYSAQDLSDWLCAALGPDSTASATVRQTARGLLACCKSGGDVMCRIADSTEYALAWRNTASLDSQLCASLFTWPMQTSASGLKTFASCPYQYFAKHILQLKERDVCQLDVLDIGMFYHAVLNAMFVQLQNKGQDWTTVDEKELLGCVKRTAEQIIAGTPAYAAFVRQSRHNAYILNQAVERLCRFVPAMKALCAAGVFRQAAAEYKFAADKLCFKISPGQVLTFKGYIDRVDCADIEGKLTAVVFDYKTSEMKMDWPKFYHGLDLQLPVYLLAAQKISIQGRPIEQVAGAFYLPIEPESPKTDYKTTGVVEQTVKGRGLLNGQFAMNLDAGAEQRSRYYYFVLDSKEQQPYSYYKTSDALRPEDFQATLDFAERKIRELVTRQIAGDIRAFPYRLGKQSPCERCDYRPVCKFDWQMNEYNIMQKLDKDQTLAQIRQVSQ